MSELFTRVRGEGPVLLMMHGLFGSADNLGGIARILEEDFRVISVDMRGHGRSPHGGDISYPHMAADAARVLDAHGVDSAFVFGHSMGGKTAMQLALSYPERVSKLVVGDISPVAYPRHHERILEGMQAVAAAAPGSRAGAEELLAPYVDEPEVLSFLLTNWRRREGGDAWGWRLDLDGIVKDYQNLMAGNEGAPYAGPVLFLRGGDSDYIQPSHREAVLALFPAAEVRTITGTGHWLHAEKPDLVARTIRKFLLG